MSRYNLKKTERSLNDQSLKPYIPQGEILDDRFNPENIDSKILDDSDIFTIELVQKIDETTSISSFSTVDLKEVEKSWTDHFEKQKPIPVDPIID